MAGSGCRLARGFVPRARGFVPRARGFTWTVERPGRECRDSIGHPFWNRDFCEAHARPVIEKAKRLKDPDVLA